MPLKQASTTLPRPFAEVSWASIDSPVGTLFAAVSEQGLVRLAYEMDDSDRLLSELDYLCYEVKESKRGVAQVERQLDDYFAGRRRKFDLDLDLRMAPNGFRRRALDAAAKIPYGETVTYRELATLAGNPNASRAAGTAMKTNPIAIVIPCHRVVRSDGSIGNYAGGASCSIYKKHLLTLEGFLTE